MDDLLHGDSAEARAARKLAEAVAALSEGRVAAPDRAFEADVRRADADLWAGLGAGDPRAVDPAPRVSPARDGGAA